MDEIIEFHTNISGKVKNTKLPKTKALWPLFELISNSIHAIEERELKDNAFINIDIIRNGSQNTLASLSNIDEYPIKSFKVTDNGIGFHTNNFISFLTSDSDYKSEKGAKGIGRFVCLKAFKTVIIESNYLNDSDYYKRNFTFRPYEKGIFDYIHEPTKDKKQGTIVTLNTFYEEYQKNCPKHLDTLADEIVEHFLICFLLDKCPYIKLREVNGKEILLQNHYATTIKGSIKNSDFSLNGATFKTSLLRVFNTRTTHNIHFCANERNVKTENLFKLLPDLGKYLKDDAGNFVYHAYITSDYLNENVDTERTDFDIPLEDEEELVTYKNIVSKAVENIETLLKPYLEITREEKFQEYKTHIYDSAPQFKPILKYKPEYITRMQPNLSGNKLNIELFKLQNELEVEVKELGDEILNSTDEVTNTAEYLEKYTKYIEKFNDIGKANLARYIVHRKAVIELLDKFIGIDDDKFQTEETIHNIFFPIKTESDEISYEQQNLWLIDERLAYHYYLSSDKSFKSMEFTESENGDRPDILIFNDSFAFVNDDAPHQSFVIIEFKRPERKDYTTNSVKKNPIDQVISYIRTIRENKAIDRRDKQIFINNNQNIPFYAYVIVDFNSKLNEIIEERDFKITPDGLGYFRYHDKYNAYIEVISYQKLLKDAKMRNRILFEKLGLPY
ncbi:MAG: ATP-binding protein [Bacteroidales bacterium]